MTEQEYAAYTAEEWIKGAAYYVRPCNDRERRLLAEGYKQGVYDTMLKMRNEKRGDVLTRLLICRNFGEVRRT